MTAHQVMYETTELGAHIGGLESSDKDILFSWENSKIFVFRSESFEAETTARFRYNDDLCSR